MTTRSSAVHRLRFLLVSAWLAVATPVHAQGVPSPANSTAPSYIALMGRTGGAVSPLGGFEVVVRDLANNPVAGARIVVDLGLCTDLHLCADPQEAGTTVDCVNRRVSRLTDAAGQAHFTLLGGSVGVTADRSPHHMGRIFWEGKLIAAPTVAAYDLDGANGLGVNDLSVWLDDFGSTLDIGRSDYDGSGSVGANDLSFWLAVFGSDTCLESCTTACP